MSAPTTPADLLDLKMMPAWVNEPTRANDYANFEGEDEQRGGRERRGPQRGREQRPRGPKPAGRREDRRDDRRRPEGRRGEREQRPTERRDEQSRAPQGAPAPLPQVAVRFLPHPAAFESVIAQIKSASVTYSVFALARLFLDKPERYDVRLTAAEGAMLQQLGENGPVATDRRLLEGGAFGALKDDFYNVEQTQSEPIKGNFSNVARDRISGTLLGPTNHHSYQPQLRNLYEQRYSRRMSFQDFQRQIEIVSDPAVVEAWKEQARSVTTYLSKGVEPAETFGSVAEAERHFRQTHLPGLLREAQELTVSGVASRRLPDRGLGRVIEEAWAAEVRSPSKMMQELAGGLRQAGLNIFRHRRGMLFVSPIRVRAFGHERAGVSGSINAILEKLGEGAALTRKQLAEKMTAGMEAADADRVKLGLASDLRWLIHEGYLIEFNDGTLDLPRPKAPPAAAAATDAAAVAIEPLAAETAAIESSPAPGPEAAAPAMETIPAAVSEATEAAASEEMVDGLAVGPEGDGGIQVEQTAASEEQRPAADV